MKAELHFGALGIVLGLATGLLSRRLEGAQTAHLFEDTLGVELRLKTLESAVDGLSFAYDYFRHKFTYFLSKWRAILAGRDRRVNLVSFEFARTPPFAYFSSVISRPGLLLLATVFLGTSLHADSLLSELDSSGKSQVVDGKQLILTENIDGKPWPKIRVYQKVDASPEQVCAMFFDYENAKAFVPNLTKSEISKKYSTCSMDVDYEISVPLLPDEKYTVRNSLTNASDSYCVSWKLIKAIQTKHSEGRIRMQPHEDGTVICYENLVVPNMPMAGLLKGVAIDQMKTTVQSLVDQVEKERKSQPKVLDKQVEELRSALKEK